MAIDYDVLMAASVSDEPCCYKDGDVMLYALAIGFGQGPEASREIDYVFEGRALRTVPTMAGNLLDTGFLADSGWDPNLAVHTEQRLQLYRPLPTDADLRADRRVVAAFDRGKNEGVTVLIESEVRMAKDDTVLFTLSNALTAPDHDGTGGPDGSMPLPHRMPSREPDLVCGLPVRTDQNLLFRLTGDRNARYVNEKEARRQGYSRTPVHEQCAAGLACRAILKTICEYDFTLIGGFDCTFPSPLYPGETLATEMWQDRNIVSFRCIAKSRDTVVIDGGKCTLAA